MKRHLSHLFRVHLVCLLLLPAFAAKCSDALPKVELTRVFAKLPLDRVVWMSEAPDDSHRFFIVGQAGKILVVKKDSDGADAKEFLNIEDRKPYFANEDGLLGLAFHPGFKTNGLFYIYYNQTNQTAKSSSPLNYPFRSVISEFKVSADDRDKADMKSERILLEVEQPFWNHKGGQITFGPDGFLYIALGDGGFGNDPYGSGQNTASLLAKMLRIDVNSRSKTGEGVHVHELQYGIPSDNPFAHEPQMGGAGARHEIFAYGLRNVWRFSFDRKSGALWGGDVGQDLWEEVDLIEKGGNYGWNVREGIHYNKPGPDGARYIDPVVEYPHTTNQLPQAMFKDHSPGLCVVGGYVYRGKKWPALEGVYIYADFVLGTIWGFRYDYEARKLTARGTLLMQPKNISSFAEDEEGELYAITLENGIYAISVAK